MSDNDNTDIIYKTTTTVHDNDKTDVTHKTTTTVHDNGRLRCKENQYLLVMEISIQRQIDVLFAETSTMETAAQTRNKLVKTIIIPQLVKFISVLTSSNMDASSFMTNLYVCVSSVGSNLSWLIVCEVLFNLADHSTTQSDDCPL